MKQNNLFNVNRFFSLLKQDYWANFFKVLLAAEALWGLLVIALIYFNMTKKSFDPNGIFFPLVLVITGLFVASISFGELSNKKKAHFFLTAPASLFEKYFSRYLFSTMGYLILILDITQQQVVF